MRIAHTIEVECPPVAVWTYLDDPSQYPRWMDGVVSTGPAAEGPGGDGVGLSLLIREGARVVDYNCRVTARKPGRRLAMVMIGGGLGSSPMMFDYRLTDLGGRTRLDYLCACRMRGVLMRLLEPIGGAMARRQSARFLANLKRLAEAECLSA